MDLALNNLQRLICHKTKPNQTNFLYCFFFSIPWDPPISSYKVGFRAVLLRKKNHWAPLFSYM